MPLCCISLSAEVPGEQSRFPALPAGARQDWWSKVQANIRAEEYQITWLVETSLPGGRDAYQTPNRAQGFRTAFTEDGIVVTPAWTVTGEEDDGTLGNAVATAGDVNGDGYADVIIGAPWQGVGDPGQEEGWAYLYMGSSSGLAAGPAWTETWTASSWPPTSPAGPSRNAGCCS